METVRKLSDLTVEEYRLEGGGPYDMEDAVLIRARQLEGPDLWKIKQRSCVLDKQGRWILEPIPSSRTRAYLRTTRWSTPEEALAFYDSWKADRDNTALGQPA